MSLSISSASNGFADFAARGASGGVRQSGGDSENGAASATGASPGVAAAQEAQSVGGESLQSNSVSSAASGGSATPPPPAASGRGQVVDIAA